MWRLRTQNKYHNQSQEVNGIRYDSKKEAAYAQELNYRMKAKDIKDWFRQVKISLDVNEKHICNYIIDFVVVHNDEMIEYVEVKGFATDTWRLKFKLFEALYSDKPNTRLTVVR